MSLQITGRLHAKFPTQIIKENFSKREFVLELAEESGTGMVYTNYASFQLVNLTCSVIDQMQEGEIITVSFNLRGNRWERDGQVKYITNLNAWRVERASIENNQPQTQIRGGAPPGGLTNGDPNTLRDRHSFSNNNQADDLPF